MLGTIAVLTYAVLAAVQIQVLNPLAAVPGIGLGEIHGAVRETGDTMGWVLMTAALLPGPLLAAAAATATWRWKISAGATAIIMLALLALGTPVYFVASFPAGMSLADTFGIGGGDHSPWARGLHGVSTAAVVALAVVVILTWTRASMNSRRARD